MATPEEQVTQEAERPEWLPEKFNSPEEMARSYSEAEQRLVALQGEVDRQREEFSQALANINEIPREAPQQTYQDPSQNPLIQQFQMAVDNGDAQAMLAIQLELNRQITAQEVARVQQELGGRVERASDVDREMAITMATERVARNYEDWDTLAPQIGEFLQARPHWIPEQASVESFERVLVEAAQIIQAEKIVAERDREEHSRQEKIAAQGLTGTGSRAIPPEEAAAEWDRIKSIDLGGYAGILGRR